MKYGAMLGISVFAISVSWAQGVRAQARPSLDTSAGAAIKDKSNDAAITSKVTSALAEDKDTAGASSAIHVQTNGGVVMLSGDVASQTTAENAQSVVARLAGVRDVVNDLKYPSPSAHTRADSKPRVVPPESGATSSD